MGVQLGSKCSFVVQVVAAAVNNRGKLNSDGLMLTVRV